MLYKITPQLTPPAEEKKPAEAKSAEAPEGEVTAQPKIPRKRRKAAIYDADGHEVLITMMCLKCKSMKPLAMFGLRKMADGAVRNQPWCRNCRSGASASKKKDTSLEETVAEIAEAVAGESVPSSLAAPAEPAEARTEAREQPGADAVSPG